MASVDHFYAATPGRRALAAVFIVPGIALFIFVCVTSMSRNPYIALCFLGIGLLSACLLVFLTTSQVRVTQSDLTRSWLLGSHTLRLADIRTVRCAAGRGQLMLTISTNSNRLLLSELTYGRNGLKQIEQDILAAHGLTETPRWPPYADYCDLAEMKKRGVPPKAS